MDPGTLQVCKIQAQMLVVSAINTMAGLMLAYPLITYTAAGSVSKPTQTSSAADASTQLTQQQQAATDHAAQRQQSAVWTALAGAVPICLPAFVSACIRPDALASQATASLLAAAAAGGSVLTAAAAQADLAPCYRVAAAAAYGESCGNCLQTALQMHVRQQDAGLSVPIVVVHRRFGTTESPGSH